MIPDNPYVAPEMAMKCVNVGVVFATFATFATDPRRRANGQLTSLPTKTSTIMPTDFDPTSGRMFVPTAGECHVLQCAGCGRRPSIGR